MEEHPERILRHAIKGMLPVNSLREERMLRLKMCAPRLSSCAYLTLGAQFRRP